MTSKVCRQVVAVGCVVIGFSEYALAAIPLLLLALIVELLVRGLYQPKSDELDVSSNDFNTVFTKAADKEALRLALIAVGIPVVAPRVAIPAGSPTPAAAQDRLRNSWDEEDETRPALEEEGARLAASADDDESRNYRFGLDDEASRRHDWALGVNPATGLAMIEGGVDMAGNLYGAGGRDEFHEHSSGSSIGDDASDNRPSDDCHVSLNRDD